MCPFLLQSFFEFKPPLFLLAPLLLLDFLQILYVAVFLNEGSHVLLLEIARLHFLNDFIDDLFALDGNPQQGLFEIIETQPNVLLIHLGLLLCERPVY